MKNLKFFPFYTLSVIPLPILYLLSDVMFVLVYYIIGYRKGVVNNNLKIAFPEKSDKEIKRIERSFYRHFCDMMVESIKTLTMGKRAVNKRIKIENEELITQLYQNNKSIVMYSAHMGNWEWNAFFPNFFQHKVTAFYQPLSNKYFDELMQLIRSRMGVLCVPSQKGYKTLMKLQQENKLTLNLIIGDQSPSAHPKASKYWTEFMHKKTAFLTGADVISHKSDYAVVYPQCTKIKRGVYETKFVLLDESPKSSEKFSLIEKYSKALEENINKQPALWLWSHNRWKLSA
ncbi:lysophospholipid acyltransferase family protein [Flammeovirga yaeyamensis]|uniref:Lysophospholipid acyltransferase family protein n=1 Tax=Flammeovirga yaeyamensis TaxID=367791 RepID=A0AAX1N7A1_9BACT|nr:lysophospholipid acyltransferase family protein [Flammeovirga yaeyamensis]MBB3699586.1 KDO2-lipid IV(A) lauroyltransferase [Flammeovirga yaeyamensis]NMF36841.1 lipid A biosynthesis acyltransferase [Flammeovirga yaeyamensis]QWG02120.1 lysophospholipid acyltransferase family protein [Flammeovirga yaeyamensis]